MLKFYIFVLIFLCATCFGPPSDPSQYEQVRGGLIDIPDGSIVEGSILYGGTQPDYVIDLNDPVYRTLFSYAKRIRESDMDDWQKIDRISEYVRHRVLKGKEYDGKKYQELLRRYRRKGADIPLSKYVYCGVGVCREYALLTHFMLKEAGIPNWHAYVQVDRLLYEPDERIIEDHAFTIVKKEGEFWAIDPYSKNYHGHLLKDLFGPQVNPNPKLAPIGVWGGNYREVRRINPYPKIWIPKKAGQPKTLEPFDLGIPNCKNALQRSAR